MYSQLCSALSTRLPQFAPSASSVEGKSVSFRRVLLNTCQEEFEGAAQLRSELRSMAGGKQGELSPEQVCNGFPIIIPIHQFHSLSCLPCLPCFRLLFGYICLDPIFFSDPEAAGEGTYGKASDSWKHSPHRRAVQAENDSGKGGSRLCAGDGFLTTPFLGPTHTSSC
jgi:hypothetical protein